MERTKIFLYRWFKSDPLMKMIPSGRIAARNLCIALFGSVPLLFTPPAAHAAASNTLVKDGKASAAIVVPFLPNTSAHWAAKEIQTHIRKITGVALPIVHEREAIPAGTVKIAVGESEITKSLGLDMADLGKQEYAIKHTPGVIALMGRDLDPDPWPIYTSGRYESTPGIFGQGWKRSGCVFGVSNHGFSDQAGTVEVWIHPESNGNLYKAMAWFGPGHEVSTSVRRKIIEFKTTYSDQKIQETITAPMIQEDWHLLSLTWDAEAGKKEILIDGKTVASGPYHKTDCEKSTYFLIGGDFSRQADTGAVNSAPASWGPIDEFRMSRVVRNYPSGAPRAVFTSDADTSILLHFEQKTGPRFENHVFSGAMPDPYQPIATCYAAYDFLEKSCGVRWYFPTELGTVTPKATTLTVTGSDVRRAPWCKSRSSIGFRGQGFEEFGARMNNILYNNADGNAADLYAMRMRQGGWRINFSHSFLNYYDRFWKEKDRRPQYFAKGYEDRAEPPQLCYTSPELIEHIVSEARASFDAGHEGFGLVPMDNWNHCKCENCKPLYEEVKDVPFSNGKSSRLIWSFTDKVARELLKTHPNHYVGQLSYADYFALPERMELSPNIIAGPCIGASTWTSLDPEKNSELKLYKEWITEKQKSGRVLSCWIYQCFPNETGGTRGFKNHPGFHAHLLDKYMKMLADDKVEGIFLCGVSSFIDGHLTLRLMDDATLDINKELDAFFPAFYGPAGVPLRKFYDAVESSYAKQAVGGTLQESYDRPGMGPLIKNCALWIEEARKLVVTEEQKQRFRLFHDAVWMHMKEGHTKYLEKFGGKDPYPFSFITEPKDREEGRFGTSLKSSGVFGLWNHGFNDEQGTIELWFKTATTGGTMVRIEGLDVESSHHIGRAPSYIDPKDGKKRYDRYFYRTVANGKTSELVCKPLSDGWHHLMATWNAKDGKMQLFIDGKLDSQGPYTKTSCAAARRFGIGGQTETFSGGGAVSNSWGNIDELRVSKVARQPIVQTEPHQPDKDTLILLHFDEPSGELPKDSSGRMWN